MKKILEIWKKFTNFKTVQDMKKYVNWFFLQKCKKFKIQKKNVHKKFKNFYFTIFQKVFKFEKSVHSKRKNEKIKKKEK